MKNKSRNIKFSLQILSYLIRGICKIYLERYMSKFKYINFSENYMNIIFSDENINSVNINNYTNINSILLSSNVNNIIKDNKKCKKKISMLPKYVKNNVNKIKDVIISSVRKAYNNKKPFCDNYSKKFNYFIEGLNKNLLNKLVNINQKLTPFQLKQFIYKEVLEILIEKGTDYLKFESLIILLKIKELKLVETSFTLESIFISYFKENYYNCPVVFNKFYEFPLMIEN